MAEKVIINDRGGGGLGLFQAKTGPEKAAETGAGVWIETLHSLRSQGGIPAFCFSF
jgi:hypothetical protein